MLRVLCSNGGLRIQRIQPCAFERPYDANCPRKTLGKRELTHGSDAQGAHRLTTAAARPPVPPGRLFRPAGSTGQRGNFGPNGATYSIVVH